MIVSKDVELYTPILGKKRKLSELSELSDSPYQLLNNINGTLWYAQTISKYNILGLTTDGFICRWFMTEGGIWNYQQQGPFVWLNTMTEIGSFLRVHSCNSEFLILNNYRTNVRTVHNLKLMTCKFEGIPPIKATVPTEHIICKNQLQSLSIYLYSKGEIMIQDWSRQMVFSAPIEKSIMLKLISAGNINIGFWTNKLFIIWSSNCIFIYEYCLDYSKPAAVLLKVVRPGLSHSMANCTIDNVIINSQKRYLTLIVRYMESFTRKQHYSAERILDFTNPDHTKLQFIEFLFNKS